MKYSVTYACGHTGTVELFGRYADRERKLEWMKTEMCPECKAAAHKEIADQLAVEAKENGLPALAGTEKQIVWAEQLRAKFFEKADAARAKSMERIEKMKESGANAPDYTKQIKQWDDTVAYIAANMVRSSWWIDHRDEKPHDVIHDMAKEAKQHAPKTEDERAASEEATLTPSKVSHGGTVEIITSEDCVSVKYVKDESFRKIIKELGYKWNPDDRTWERSISYFTGSPEDRAAEAANALLIAGFTVRCFNENVRRMAVDANFKPEQKKWISARKSGDYEDWFAIKFPRGDQKSYDRAHALKGARWSNPSIVVPAEYYELVLDFAEINGFSISPGARKLMVAQVERRRNAVTPASQVPAAEDDLLKRILASSGEVLDDLKDD